MKSVSWSSHLTVQDHALAATMFWALSVRHVMLFWAGFLPAPEPPRAEVIDLDSYRRGKKP